MITEFNEKGHPMVFSDESVNTEQLKEKCIKAIESLSGVHGAAERKAEACFMIALSELENNWKERAEAAEARLTMGEEISESRFDRICELQSKVDFLYEKLAELEKQEPVAEVTTWWPLGVAGGEQRMLQPLVSEYPEPGTKLFTRPAPAADIAKMCDRQYIAGLQAGFRLGDAGDNEGMNKAIANYRKQIIDSRKRPHAAADLADLLPVVTRLKRRYVCNEGRESEFIACVTPERSSIGTGQVWDDWRELSAILRNIEVAK